MTEFQKQIVLALEGKGRMTTEEIAEIVGRSEKSVKKALKYLHGAEMVQDHQKAPPMEIPYTEQDRQQWLKEVEQWKESGNPTREDRWELLPEDQRNKTLQA